MNRRIVFRTGLVLTALGCTLGAAAAPAPMQHFESKSCGYEFDYPPDWKATAPPEPPAPAKRAHGESETHAAANCVVQLRPRRIGDHAAAVEDYTLEFQAFNGSFLHAAELNGFDFVSGSWSISGQDGARNGAVVLNNRQWSGIKVLGLGIAPCRVDPNPANGGEMTLCDEYRAVLQDTAGHVWTVRGGSETDEAFESLLFTLRVRE